MPPTTRKPVRRPAQTDAVPEHTAPMVLMRRTRNAQPVEEQVLLFAKEYDDGETQEFWVPKRRMASLALKYMRKVRDDGDDVATAWLLEEVLGTPAYEDLMEDDQLSEDELMQVFAIVQNAVMGATGDPKGRRG